MARLLLTEDDSELRKQYALYLRSADGGSHTVDEAGSATQAVTLLRANEYDLLLLDIMMAYQPDDEENDDIDDDEVDYGRKLGLYVYNEALALPRPPRIVLVSVVREAATIAEFTNVVGRLPKYFALGELGTLVAAALAVPQGGEEARL